MEKVGRNDPCPCGSGKKFKKCCENKDKHKKFHAEVLSSGPTSEATKTSSLFFKRSIAPLPPSTPPVPEEPKNPVM
jgi:hypothetical protein